MNPQNNVSADSSDRMTDSSRNQSFFLLVQTFVDALNQVVLDPAAFYSKRSDLGGLNASFKATSTSLSITSAAIDENPKTNTLNLALSVSGGRDSMLMVEALKYILDQGLLGYQLDVCVLHVQHGLLQMADQWVDLVRDVATSYGWTFSVHYLNPNQRLPAQSIEAWAREERYQALHLMAAKHHAKVLFIAHHQDDQVESHLLMKERGAGAKGLAAMPKMIIRNHLLWCRPWLNVPYDHIVQASVDRGINYIEDPSNTDTRFARNRIRQMVRSPLFRQTHLAQVLADIEMAQQQCKQQRDWAAPWLNQNSAACMAEIGECARLRIEAAKSAGSADLDESSDIADLAEAVFDVTIPAAAIDDPTDDLIEDNSNRQEPRSKGLPWHQFDDEQKNILIREWFAVIGWRMPSQASLRELIKQLSSTKQDHQMCWRHPDGGLVGKVNGHWIAAQVPVQGALWIAPGLGDYARQNGLSMRPRPPSVLFRLGCNRPRRRFKDVCQNLGIPVMLRGQIPFLYNAKGQLVYIAGIGQVFE